MGMTLQMRRGEPGQIAQLASGDGSPFEFLCPDEKDDPAYKDGSIVDLDKAWHTIHFLLTKSAWDTTLPAGFMLNGTEVGEDMSYGPVRTLTPEQVRDVAALIEELPENFVEAEFDFARLEAADVYPTIWDRRDPTDIEYTSIYFKELRRFISDAAAKGEGVALAIL